MNFIEFGLNEELIEAISYMGFEKATPIQDMAIPAIMQGKDLIGCAQTGTGKTAAFTLPILQHLYALKTDPIPSSPRVLVLTPTRELAQQVANTFISFGKHLPHSIGVGTIIPGLSPG